VLSVYAVHNLRLVRFHWSTISLSDFAVVFLLTFHSNHRPISHRFRDKRRCTSKIAQKLPSWWKNAHSNYGFFKIANSN